MKLIIQGKFDPPSDRDLLVDPLYVHARAKNANTSLVLFIHGLNGKRYDTWGRLPGLIFKDHQNIDVGMYGYRTGLQRLFRRRSPSLEEEGEVVCDILRDLEQYKNLFLIGHSMGGLLCKAAIKSLVLNNDRNTLTRLKGLLLMATPQAGAVWFPSFLNFLSLDLLVLRYDAAFLQTIDQVFQNHIVTDVRADHGNSRVRLPTFAVIGADDRWVSRLSAGLNLRSEQKKIVRGGHSEINKPASEEDDAYSWIVRQIKSSLASNASNGGAIFRI